ncbi:MAG: hypothetical protein KBD06_00915 [Candidatus Pacebacteria bacterium]|nr:hypothetical protein [Candidatus Paceibacterota bacterium]
MEVGMTQAVSLKITATEEGMEGFSKAIPRFLVLYQVALLGFKLLPPENGVWTCILTVAFEFGDMSVEQKTQPFRQAISGRPDVTSVTIIPTEA